MARKRCGLCSIHLFDSVCIIHETTGVAITLHTQHGDRETMTWVWTPKSTGHPKLRISSLFEISETETPRVSQGMGR